MISEHTYTATVEGHTLSVRSGSVGLDTTRAPHVQGDVEVSLPGVWQIIGGQLTWVPDPAAYALLDPRSSPPPRVVITAAQTDGPSRTFDLHVRDRRINHRAGTVSLSVASDEGILTDWAPLADDYTPLTLASSLRAVVNYVLGKAIPGAVLAAAPSNDANVTPYWSVTNLQRNPAVIGDVSNWTQGGGCTIAYVAEASSGAVRVSMTSASGAVYAVDTSKYNLNAQPGRDYSLSFLVRNEGTVRAGETATVVLRFLDNNNATIVNVAGTARQIGAGYAKIKVSGRAPANAAKIAPYVSFAGSQSGRVLRIDAAMLYEGDPLIPVDPFTGADNDTSTYTYDFQGPANDSPSVRTPVIERDPESLIWKAGQSALDILHPLVQAAGFRLVCDEGRVWTLRSETFSAPGSIAIRSGANIIDADEMISRDAGIWFDARATVYEWTDRNGIQQTRTDAYALTPGYSRMTRLELSTPYPGPGRSEYAVRRAQGVGREVTVDTVSNWDATPEQALQLILDQTPPLVGNIQSVSFDLGNDRMTITTRARDVPVGAIDLIVGTINALPGTINAL